MLNHIQYMQLFFVVFIQFQSDFSTQLFNQTYVTDVQFIRKTFCTCNNSQDTGVTNDMFTNTAPLHYTSLSECLQIMRLFITFTIQNNNHHKSFHNGYLPCFMLWAARACKHKLIIHTFLLSHDGRTKVSLLQRITETPTPMENAALRKCSQCTIYHLANCYSKIYNYNENKPAVHWLMGDQCYKKKREINIECKCN